jgi:ornithine cyclodeaminase
VLILSESDVAARLSMRDTIDVVQRAFIEHAHGRAVFPLRSVAMAESGLLGAMPGSIRGEHAALGAKLVTVFSGNAARGAHTHNAVIILFSPETGDPLALMDGRYITEIRTAAVSAIASRALARPEASTVAILGTGVQARAHIEAMRTLESITSIRIWGRDFDKAAALAKRETEGGIPVHAVATIGEACHSADIVCTVTATAEPVLSAGDIAPGTHINAVGACTPRARELTAELVGQTRIVCDSREGALAEAGDIILAMRDGALPAQPEISVLGDVLAGKTVGRTSVAQITLFKSLGVAIEDLACAALVYERAFAQRAGTTVKL